MKRERLNFKNVEGHSLAGLLELPTHEPAAFAIFVHCFTCSKNFAAASRIARGLAERGLAVLRFDFTGLGNSDGDFANTNFSSNIQDLIAAAAHLEAEFRAPELLIGHSLGGAAVLAAAHQLPSVRALATIGAPARAEHVQKLFADEQDQIRREGQATVTLGGRNFQIKRQLLQDLESYNDTEHLSGLGRALLILHSPTDDTVGIAEAGELFRAAKHPKSFVSLDGADHLVSQPEDANFVADIISAWAGRYLASDSARPARPEVARGEVTVWERDHHFTRDVFGENHALVADEPERVGGSDMGPNPYELLLAALGACTSMTVRMYANHKQLPLEDVQVSLRHGREHVTDCDGCEDEGRRIEVIEKRVRLEGPLSPEQRQRLLEIVERCPVNKTLKAGVRSRVVDESEAP